MENKVQKYIRCNSLLKKEGMHLVALSGGADSVCLILVLQKLGYNVEAIHCNFHLRGEESDRDEAFCRDLCQKKNIPFHTVHFDTHTYAELHKVSIEMAARDLRYGYFERLRQDIGAEDICVAHHKDDNVETVLMNIIRGTGLTGLIGIRPKNGNIVRPLLCVSRKEILGYLAVQHQDYVTDSTNLINDVTRNKLRLDIIPLLQKINPAVQDNIIQMTEHLADVEKITNSTIEKEISEITGKDESTPLTLKSDSLTHQSDFGHNITAISIEKLSHTTSPAYVLFTILHPYGFSSSQIKEASALETLQSGKLWQSQSHTLVVDRVNLLLAPKAKEVDITMRIPEEGTYVLRNNSKLFININKVEEGFSIAKTPDIATLDADKVKLPLTVRRIQMGDRFTPFGMKGSKLVSDYLTDKKRNYFQRQQQLVLIDAQGSILWLIGERPDGRFCITKNTIKAVVIRYICSYEFLHCKPAELDRRVMN